MDAPWFPRRHHRAHEGRIRLEASSLEGGGREGEEIAGRSEGGVDVGKRSAESTKEGVERRREALERGSRRVSQGVEHVGSHGGLEPTTRDDLLSSQHRYNPP